VYADGENPITVHIASISRVNLFAPPAVGAIAVLGLLAAFTVVVRESVRQGDARRSAATLLVEATWRCKALPTQHLREPCLLRVQRERPIDSAGLQALVITAGASAPVAATSSHLELPP
jgi:hypothetical protein